MRRRRSTIFHPTTYLLQSFAEPARGGRSAAGSSSSAKTSRRTSEAGTSGERSGYGLDALWNDDLHHSAPRGADRDGQDAYYTDYRGNPQELISAAKYGFLFQGQRYNWHGRPAARTASSAVPPWHFVTFLETTIRSRIRRAACAPLRTDDPGRSGR